MKLIASNRAELIPTALAEQEEIIERGVHSLIDVGQALMKIKVGKLYKDEYETFDDYCPGRWGFAKSFAYYQIAASEAARNVSTIVDNQTVTEGLLRPIANLAPEQQKAVIKQAISSAPDGKLTAKRVTQASNAYREKHSRDKPAKTRRISDDEKRLGSLLHSGFELASAQNQTWAIKTISAWDIPMKGEFIQKLTMLVQSLENWKIALKSKMEEDCAE